MKLIDTKALATDVTAHEVSPQTVNVDPSAYSRIGWLIIVFGVLGFLIWAIFAPLDKGVPMSGNVAKEGNRKAIQYQLGGTVERILVKEGEQVKKGQVLVRMNAVNVTAQSEVSKTQLLALLATEARLLAERDGKSALVHTAEMAAYQKEPIFQDNLQQQVQLLASRQGALASELAAAEESIAGLKFQIAGLQAAREAKQQQLAILKEQVGNLRELARDGYVARARLLDVERSYSQTEGGIAEDAANIGRCQRQIAELTLKRAQRTQDYQKEVRTLLSDVQRDARALMSRQVAETYAVGSVEVKSPVDGFVIGMAVFTEGAWCSRVSA
ncbi:HlyD family type I secretion periplasmic adaptor subunit [Pseudoduganella danionis]|uniref:HlyD family type I secretion periplasmic adaptor subunit n=1 Tax=Pseudoduganella danionis TaxID=1890295 RepID=UPI00360ECE93